MSDIFVKNIFHQPGHLGLRYSAQVSEYDDVDFFAVLARKGYASYAG
jgi:hypothetical protein